MNRWHAGIAGLVALVTLTNPAAGHALLVDAEPNPNTRVDEAPERLELSFSEELEDSYTRVQVVDTNNTDHVDAFTIEDPARRTVTVELANVTAGLYSVQWRTLSAADGHTKAGGYLIGVDTPLTPATGEANATQPAANATTQATAQPGSGEAVTRAIGYTGAALAVGLPLVALTLPANRQRDALLIHAAAIGAGVAAVAALGLVAFLARRIDVVFGQALDTQNGTNEALRALAFATAGGLLALSPRFEDRRRLHALAGAGVFAGAVGVLATGLAGHAAAVETWRELAIGLDAIHQLAVAYWLAGVAVLTWLAIANTSRDELAAAIRRLSPAFVAAVALIVATGSYASWVHLDSLELLWTTGYGLALLAKIVLLAPLVALGGYHRYVLSPRLEEAGSRSRLRRTIVLEVAVMVLVLLAAGFLTNSAPPSLADPTGPTADEATTNATAEPDIGTIVHQANGSDYRFEVGIRPHPVSVGAQNLSVRLAPTDGFPDNASALLNAKPPSDPYGEGDTSELTRWTNRTWTIEGPVFTESGTWRLLVALQGKDAYAQTTFELDVGR